MSLSALLGLFRRCLCDFSKSVLHIAERCRHEQALTTLEERDVLAPDMCRQCVSDPHSLYDKVSFHLLSDIEVSCEHVSVKRSRALGCKVYIAQLKAGFEARD